MFIEDILFKSVSIAYIKFNTFDSKLIYSIHNQLVCGNKLTEKQGLLLVSVLKKYKNSISQYLNKDISLELESPIFKNAFRQSTNTVKLISIISHQDWKKAISVEFPYQEEIISKVKLFKSKFFRGMWNQDEKRWIFPLDEQNIELLTNLGKEFNFSFSEEFADYASQVVNFKENLESIIPVLSIESNLPVLKNIDKFVPKLTTDDVVAAIFQARKFGIYHWDDSVSTYLNESKLPKSVKSFLQQDPGIPYSFNTDKNEIFDIISIVKNLSPSIFILPGGSEFEKLKVTYNLLIGSGIDNSEISVMFRLPSETGRMFNDFIRDNKINNPLSKNTKVIIVGTKIPKPIIQSDIKIHSVFNFGINGVHYSLRNFIKNQENMIHITEKNSYRETSFAIL
jgi:hypothetical protein